MYTGRLVEYQMGEWIQVGGPSALMVRYGHSQATGPVLAMVRLQPWYDGDPSPWKCCLMHGMTGKILTETEGLTSSAAAKRTATAALQRRMQESAGAHLSARGRVKPDADQ